jgi:hypothetical protein
MKIEGRLNLTNQMVILSLQCWDRTQGLAHANKDSNMSYISSSQNNNSHHGSLLDSVRVKKEIMIKENAYIPLSSFIHS